jgi:hypothetical protein
MRMISAASGRYGAAPNRLLWLARDTLGRLPCGAGNRKVVRTWGEAVGNAAPEMGFSPVNTASGRVGGSLP